MPPVEIQTPVAFIKGHVEVTKSIPESNNDQIQITANQNGQNATSAYLNALQASKQALPYSLTVTPGNWQIYAKLGPAVSENHPVTVKSGEAVEVDFAFGADPD